MKTVLNEIILSVSRLKFLQLRKTENVGKAFK